MRVLKYKLSNGTVVNTMTEAVDSGLKYELIMENVKTAKKENFSPIRKAMIEQFGYVHKKLLDKVKFE